MRRKYRVWTKNASCCVQLSVMTDWMTWSRCRQFIIGRWGHWPPWAFISACQSSESFIRYNGD